MVNEVVVILSIVTVFVAVLNIFCISVILYTKRLHKAAHMAISSLLLAHTIQGLVVIPSYAIKRAEISKDHRICDTFRFSYFFTNYASCLSLLVISIDRCLGVLFPLKYKMFITPKRMMIIIALVWSYVFALTMIPFAPNNKIKCKYYPNKKWTLTMLLGHTLLPFVIISCCYGIIFSKVKIILRVRKSQRSASFTARKKQWNKSKTSIIIVAVYIICWGPSFVYYTLLMLCSKCFTVSYLTSDAEQYVTFIMKLLTFLDGILAPLIYCFNNRSFSIARQKFIRNMKLQLLPNSCQSCVQVDKMTDRSHSTAFCSSYQSPSTQMNEIVDKNNKPVSSKHFSKQLFTSRRRQAFVRSIQIQ